MFTSRAEYRILMRQDNADIRLTPLAFALGIDNMVQRMARVNEKLETAKNINHFIEKLSIGPDQVNAFLTSNGYTPITQKLKLKSLLLRPGLTFPVLRQVIPELDVFLSGFNEDFIEHAEIDIKYQGYIQKEKEMVEKMNRLENVKLLGKLDYHSIQSLSTEAREKLSRIKPATIGQASRISGVSPSDVSVLLVHMGR